MKKYIIIYASHIESDGLDSGNSIVCDTREEAQQILKNNYQGLKKSINKEDCSKEFYDDELNNDSYYISLSSTYGFAYYQAQIKEIEI